MNFFFSESIVAKMSVDVLLKELPADQSLRTIMQAMEVVHNLGNKLPKSRSPVVVLAQEFVPSGQEGLKETFKDYKPGDGLDIGVEMRAQIETSAISLGSAVSELELGVKTGIICLSSIPDNVNSPLAATSLNLSCRLPEKSTIVLTDHEYREIIACLKKDPTFCAFFDEPHYLPPDMRDYLEKEKVFGMPFLTAIQVHILSNFRERARFLLPQREPQLNMQP